MAKSRSSAGRAERLQKVAARTGLGSRRSVEQAIRDGRARINGERAELGQTVARGDTVKLGRTTYRAVAKRAGAGRVLLYHKPTGEVTTRKDPRGRPTVFDHLPSLKRGRWIAIGRLDINSSGLLLFTTDGDLADRMMHPSGRVDKEYLCRIHGALPQGAVDELVAGVELDDGPARFTDAVAGEAHGTNRWYTVTVFEGRNRIVRRLWESRGVKVNRLKRVRYGAVFLPRDLRPGHRVELQPSDVRVLREDVGLGPAPSRLILEPVKPSRKRRRRK